MRREKTLKLLDCHIWDVTDVYRCAELIFAFQPWRKEWERPAFSLSYKVNLSFPDALVFRTGWQEIRCSRETWNRLKRCQKIQYKSCPFGQGPSSLPSGREKPSLKFFQWWLATTGATTDHNLVYSCIFIDSNMQSAIEINMPEGDGLSLRHCQGC